jgi:hypothetical protein
MRNTLAITMTIVSILFLSSCYFDKKDQIYPQAATATCDTANVTYSLVVAPSIKANCAACHATSVANMSGAGIVLDNYTSLKPYITNNYFLNSIVQNGSVPPMPLNGPKIDACSIKKISVWINKGALNN